MDHSSVLVDERPDAPSVAAELLCFSCAYSLRGIDASGVCPECGTPVETSVRAGPLMLGDRVYVRALWRGSGRIVYAMIFAVAAMVLSYATPLLAGPGPSGLVLVLPGMALWLLAAVFGVWGWWTFTTRDANRPAGAKGRVSRVITRAALVIYLALVLAGLAAIPFPGAWGAMSTLSSLGWLAFMVGVAAGLRYARVVAARIPDKASVRRARVALWLFVVVVLASIAFVASLVLSLVQGFGGGPAIVSEAVLMLVVIGSLAAMGLGSLAGLVVFFMLFLRMRRKFRGILEATGG